MHDQQGFIQIIHKYSTRRDLLSDKRNEALLMDPLANERIKELTAAMKETVNQHSITCARAAIYNLLTNIPL